jgi:hypothetical protein
MKILHINQYINQSDIVGGAVIAKITNRCDTPAYCKSLCQK